MKNKIIADWSDELYSKASVPGGGGASAMAGSMAAALAGMVANLTSGKKKYAAYQEDIERILIETNRLRTEFLELMQEDAESFEPLSKAYGLPKGTAEELAYRDAVMEAALDAASLVPLHIMKTVTKLLPILDELTEKGSKIALSDVGVSLSMARATLTGASMNVYINTKMMKDRQKALDYESRADTMVAEGLEKIDLLYQSVLEELRG